MSFLFSLLLCHRKVNLLLLLLLMPSHLSIGKITFSPYVSLRSTKSVNPSSKSSEEEKIKQHQEVGIRAGLSLGQFFKLELGIGQSKATATEKKNEITDEYQEIDFETDLNMSTDDPENEIKTTDIQNRAKFSFIVDLSFSIFIARTKIGVTAQQRQYKIEELNQPTAEVTKGPTYKPHSGLGFGIRFSPQMYFLAEYSFYHYLFPDIEPFERQLTASYNIAI